MAWNPQGGGGGGPWGGGGNNQGPWGGGGRGPTGGGGRGPTPPDIEEMLRKSQERMKGFMPGGGLGGARGFGLIVIVLALVWAVTGFYRVQPGEVGVQILFGEYVSQTPAGLHWWMPAPMGEVIKPQVEKVNTIPVGYRGGESVGGRTLGKQDVPQESLMLTGDQNIIDLKFQVQWKIKNAADFLFNIRNPVATIKAAAESSMREVVGQTTLENTLSKDRPKVQANSQKLLQQILDAYGSGVLITEVKLQETDPPQEVIDAFNDVQRAKQDQERLVNEANTYRNDIVPRAKGQGERMIQQATAYKEQMVNEAKGEAQRFIDIYNAYAQNKSVTRKRLYLERMQNVMGNATKIIIDEKAQGKQGVVPYLPLNQMGRFGPQRPGGN
ncbi:FtsH protease activity modulator HflK [Magnetospira sp. QH-2]|uniref:FtsH protease activity modulator HflK n=1 Tax=Magnetospira sp. (strain QH-2) TaxID=1288970 RepID=UPI0003E812C8|nr:FtsH protease activity modulator HflK [Magnetospira sp. QH-2]CCQ73482.1 Protease activity modulator HflK [Magnetospira sp. QH-2]